METGAQLARNYVNRVQHNADKLVKGFGRFIKENPRVALTAAVLIQAGLHKVAAYADPDDQCNPNFGSMVMNFTQATCVANAYNLTTAATGGMYGSVYPLVEAFFSNPNFFASLCSNGNAGVECADASTVLRACGGTIQMQDNYDGTSSLTRMYYLFTAGEQCNQDLITSQSEFSTCSTNYDTCLTNLQSSTLQNANLTSLLQVSQGKNEALSAKNEELNEQINEMWSQNWVISGIGAAMMLILSLTFALIHTCYRLNKKDNPTLNNTGTNFSSTPLAETQGAITQVTGIQGPKTIGLRNLEEGSSNKVTINNGVGAEEEKEGSTNHA